MIDPSELLRRAAELTERADQEEDVETAIEDGPLLCPDR